MAPKLRPRTAKAKTAQKMPDSVNPPVPIVDDLAVSLTIAAPFVLNKDVDYSGTALVSMRDSIRLAAPLVASLADKADEYCKLKRFILFPKLAPELRVKIWKEAMSGSRVLPVWPKNDQRTVSRKGDYLPKMMVHRSPPAILQVCRESREEGMKKYSWTADTIGHKSYHRADVAEDIIYFVISDWYPEIHEFAACFEEGALRQVEHLALDTQFLYYTTVPRTLIGYFPKLKTITLVKKCPNHSKYRDEFAEGRSLPTHFSLKCWDNPKKISVRGSSRAITSCINDNVESGMLRLKRVYRKEIEKRKKEGVEWDPPLLKFCPSIDEFECFNCKHLSDSSSSRSPDTESSGSSVVEDSD